jgi:hypothetical protein
VIVAFVEVDEFYSVAELVLWPKDKHYYWYFYWTKVWVNLF